MTALILGRDYPARMDLLIAVAKWFNCALDRVVSGAASQELVITLAGLDICLVMFKKPRAAAPLPEVVTQAQVSISEALAR